MAQWVPRTRTDGSVVVQIRWRRDGRQYSETFTNVRLATEFRTAVEAAGNQWPEGWVRGEGWAIEPPPPPTPVRPTVAEVATGELGYFVQQERRVKRGKLEPYTLHRDRRCYVAHLEEFFGHLTFEDVDEQDVAAWIDEQLEAGAAPKTIRNRHGLLSSILSHGRRRLKLRPDNPCELSELPDLHTARPEARQIRFFQRREWTVFRSCLAPDVRLLVDVALATGLRWGELSALRVGDLTFSGHGADRQASLHIVRAWSRRSPEDGSVVKTAEQESATWVLGPPKSKRPRWVVVTGEVASRLESLVEARRSEDYVFVTSQGNPWRYPDFHTERWTPAKKQAAEAGLDKHVTPHMLRHTAVVWSLAAGVRTVLVAVAVARRPEPRARVAGFVRGLLAGLPRTTCWSIAEDAGEDDPRGMQRLLAGAVWDTDGVRDDLREYVVENLRPTQPGLGAVLVVDETGDVKKGTKTVGVQRQYSGTAGRVENCQVAVYLAYATTAGYTVIDHALYLPKAWTEDAERMKAAGVPGDVEFATKPALATAMITRVLERRCRGGLGHRRRGLRQRRRPAPSDRGPRPGVRPGRRQDPPHRHRDRHPARRRLRGPPRPALAPEQRRRRRPRPPDLRLGLDRDHRPRPGPHRRPDRPGRGPDRGPGRGRRT